VNLRRFLDRHPSTHIAALYYAMQRLTRSLTLAFLFLARPIVNGAYRLVFILRLGVMLLEKQLLLSSAGQKKEQGASLAKISSGALTHAPAPCMQALCMIVHGGEAGNAPYRHAGAAWFEFCEQLKGAGELIAREADAPGVRLTDLDRIEGMRYLTRAMRGGVENLLDCFDVRYPVLRPL
jgi:hypothetical protein